MKRKDLIRQCQVLRGDILARGLATESEIEEYWPERGRAASTEDWVYCSQNMVRLRGREEWLGTKKEDAEEEVLKAIRDEPEPVDLFDGQTVLVHPKSLHALLWYRERDWVIDWLSSRLEAVKSLADSGDLSEEDLDGTPPSELIDRFVDAVSFELACLCSEACHPEPSLSEDPNDPGGEFLELDPIETIRINRAFLEVNGGRLRAVDAIVKPSGSSKNGEGVSWNVFYGTLSKTLKIPVRTLSREQSLPSLLAGARLSRKYDDRREEMEEALG